MKFAIRRSGQLSDDVPPHPRAYRAKFIRIDERTADDPTKIPAYLKADSSWWYGKGRNHRVEHGHIKRDFDCEDWFVDVVSVEELVELIVKNGAELREYYYNSDFAEIVLNADEF